MTDIFNLSVYELMLLLLSDEIEPFLLEHTSGGCNILHVLSFLGQPPVPSRSPSPSSSSSLGGDRRGTAARTTPRSGVLREIMKQAMALASSSGPAHSLGGLYIELYSCLVTIVSSVRSS